MAFLLCYTKPGEGLYPNKYEPGLTAQNCDWEQAMHLAISDDGKSFKPLRNNTGVLFSKCTFDEGNPKGTTKTLKDPWLVRTASGRFMVCAIRCNQNAPDPKSVGSIMLFVSDDLVHYREAGFLRVSDEAIRRPRCAYDPEKSAYVLSWENSAGQAFSGLTKDFTSIESVTDTVREAADPETYGIPDCVPGNVLEITEAEAHTIRLYLDEIHFESVDPVELTVPAGTRPERLPKAVCRYSDGSTHEKKVEWDLSEVDFDCPGEYSVPGRIFIKRWPFPFKLSPLPYTPGTPYIPPLYEGMTDPCITEYKGKYYLSASCPQNIVLRRADAPEDVFAAPPVIIYKIPMKEGETFTMSSAAELHVIDGILYMFTAISPNGNWTLAQSVVLRCNGEDPLAPGAWDAPVYCVRPDGRPLMPSGLTLDMTYFRDGGRDYVMWSGRKVHYGTDPIIAEPALLEIATIDPAKPWQLTCDPICIVTPSYGWDRIETEVDEGPYLLRRGDDLFVTFSGASTGLADLYSVGLLRAKQGTDLLDPESWEELGYPILTKESVPGQFGPGHNSFLKDPDTGDDLMVYHAVPHDENDMPIFRLPAMRRVHWAASGLPYLELTPDKDLPADHEQIVMTLKVV